MAFSPRFLDDIRSRLSIAEVVGRKVRLIRKGREHSGLCPFHNEKTPSFTVSDEKGFYHCFGCGAHGDVIGFAMRANSLSFPEAVERLAAEAGLEVPKASPEERERAQREAGLHDVMEAACAYYERMLRAPEGRKALAYLQERGLSEETIARFRLGFAPDDKTALKLALLGDGITKELMIEAGLLIQPDDNREPYDRFRGRVMFPIGDKRGRIIAFGGRVMGEGEPKYLNSPETPLFHKGRVLFALAQAREAARQAGTLLVCEGYMDVIALHQAGLGYAVAPLGTALTEEQMGELWRVAPEPVLCFDGDNAGRRAAGRALERALPLLKPGFSLRFAELPQGEDPDSLVKSRGAPAMEALIAQARPLIDLLWELEAAGHKLETPEQRAALEKRLLDQAGRIADETVRGHYRSSLKDRIWQAFKAHKPQARGGGGWAGGRSRSQTVTAPITAPMGGGPRLLAPPELAQQRLLLASLIAHPKIADQVGERLGNAHFPDGALDKLRQEVLKHLADHPELDSGGLRHYLAGHGWGETLADLAAPLLRRMDIVSSKTPIDLVVKGFRHTLELLESKVLGPDIALAEQRLASETTEEGALEAHQALVTLREEEEKALGAGSDDDDETLGNRS
jgi:DNA primase